MTIIDWLLDSDPSIRWQVMRDLTDASAEDVAAERARVAYEGWGARLLALQGDDGRWGGGTYFPEWTSNDPHPVVAAPVRPGPRERRGTARHRPRACQQPVGARRSAVLRGRGRAMHQRLGRRDRSLLRRGHRGHRRPAADRADGRRGWNCEQENGSTRGSFNSTICVLEGLLEYERAAGGSPEVTAALLGGQEYLLARRLFRRESTGEVVDPDWLRFSFPTGWHYDVLRGLDYLRSAGVQPDERVAEAVALVESKRDADRRWPLKNLHHDELAVVLGEGDGRPSRWNTLRALRILRWYEQVQGSPSSTAGSFA